MMEKFMESLRQNTLFNTLDSRKNLLFKHFRRNAFFVIFRFFAFFGNKT